MINSAIRKQNTNVNHEDSLTSTIFELLLLLPERDFGAIVNSSIRCSGKLPSEIGKLDSYVFWPNWPPDGTTNGYYVQPDLFLSFSNIDIIIEAKKQEGKQSSDQWKNEIIAYKNKYGPNNKDVVLIALDGNGSLKKETIQNISIYKTSWEMLCESFSSYEGIEKTPENERLKKLISDGFLVFGFRSLQPLKACPEYYMTDESLASAYILFS